jgi:hypothetical protein
MIYCITSRPSLYDPHRYLPASGTRLGPASLSQLAQCEFAYGAFGIVTPGIGHVVICVAAPFHDRFFPVSFSFHLSSFPMLLRRLAHPWIICPCSHFIITHVFQFPLRAPVGSSICFMFRTRYLGYLYNMYSWLSCTVVLISTLFSLATLFPPLQLCSPSNSTRPSLLVPQSFPTPASSSRLRVQ